jgi:hypothetical protein
MEGPIGMNMQQKVRLMALMKYPIEKLSQEEVEYAKSINLICEKSKRICFGQGRECEKCEEQSLLINILHESIEHMESLLSSNRIAIANQKIEDYERKIKEQQQSAMEKNWRRTK